MTLTIPTLQTPDLGHTCLAPTGLQMKIHRHVFHLPTVWFSESKFVCIMAQPCSHLPWVCNPTGIIAAVDGVSLKQYEYLMLTVKVCYGIDLS